MLLGTRRSGLLHEYRRVSPKRLGQYRRGSLLAGVYLILTMAHATAGEVVRVFNWANYVDPGVLQDFERDTGIKVDYSEFHSAAELDTALAAGQRFDVIVPSDFQLDQLIDQQRLVELDQGKLPNRSQVSSELLARITARSRADRFVAPYMWGTVGLVVNEEQASKLLQKPVANSWSILFDPASANKLKSCGATLGSVPEQALSLFLNYKGRSLQNQNARVVQKAAHELDALDLPLWTGSFSSFISDLAEGRICAAITWNGIAAIANTKGNLRYSIPQEGGLVFIDSFAIPRNAPNQAAAYRFIDYMLRPANAARNAKATHFTPSLDLEQPSNQKLLSERTPLSSDEKRRLFLPERFSTEQRQAIGKVWPTLSSAAHE